MKNKFINLWLVLVIIGIFNQGFSANKNIPQEVSKWLASELENTSTQVLENFESPNFYTSKNAKVVGYIKGYDQTKGAKTGIFYYTNELTRETKPKVLEIHADGRFELELPLEYPMYNHIYIANKWVDFYIEPGQYLSIILDKEKVNGKNKTKISYQGMLKKINTDLLKYKPKYSYRKLNKMREEMDALTYKKEMYRFKKSFLGKIRAYLQSGEIDKKTAELLENEIVLVAYKRMFDYFSLSRKVKFERKGLDLYEQIPADYFDFIKEIPFDKQSVLVNDSFGTFVNSLEFSKPLKVKRKTKGIVYENSYLKFLKFIEDKNIKLTNEELELLKNGDIVLRDKTKAAEKREKLNAFAEKHQEVFNEFLTMVKMDFQRKQEEEFKRLEKEDLRLKDSLANRLGIQNKLVYDIIKSRNLEFNMFRRGKSEEMRKWWWSFMKENIKSPHLHKMGDEFLKKSLSQTKVYDLPTAEKGTAVFKKMIAPYVGKVVFVQYWNPRSYYRGKDLERIKKRRAQFKNNQEVVFLDMTCEDFSTLEEYNKSVKENDFENTIRITQDEYHYLLQLFEFRGEVKNIMVSPEGKIVRGYRGSHMLVSFLKENFNIEPNNQDK